MSSHLVTIVIKSKGENTDIKAQREEDLIKYKSESRLTQLQIKELQLVESTRARGKESFLSWSVKGNTALQTPEFQTSVLQTEMGENLLFLVKLEILCYDSLKRLMQVARFIKCRFWNLLKAWTFNFGTPYTTMRKIWDVRKYEDMKWFFKSTKKYKSN